MGRRHPTPAAAAWRWHLLLLLLLPLAFAQPQQQQQQQPDGGGSIEGLYRFPLCLQPQGGGEGGGCADTLTAPTTHDKAAAAAATATAAGGHQAFSAPGAGAVLSVAWDTSSSGGGYVLTEATPSSSGGKGVMGSVNGSAALLLVLANATVADAGSSGWHQLAVAAHVPPATTMIPDQGSNNSSEATRWLLRAWYAAGLLEGYLTAPLIADYARNIRAAAFDTRYPSMELLDFVEANRRWMREQASARLLSPSPSSPSSPFPAAPPQAPTTAATATAGEAGERDARQSDVEAEAWLGAAAVMAQFEGLVAGYQASATGKAKPLTEVELFLVNSYGDLFDLEHRFPSDETPPPRLYSDDKALDTRWFWAPAPMRTDGGEARPHSDNTGSGKEAVVAGLSGDQGDKAAAAAYDESHDQDRCTVLFKATTPTTTTNTNGKGEGDVLVAHTTFDYYVAAWQRVVKDVVLPVLPVNLPPPPPPPLPPSDPANENADRAAQQEQGGEGDKRRAGRGKEAPPQEQEQPPPVPVPVLPPRTRQLFSASAGQLASLDDFYVIRGEGTAGSEVEGKRLVVTETTTMMKRAKASLVELFTPHALLYWVRVGAANAWARDGEHWAQLFGVGNSGTYNSEWMVLDPANRKFWVLDQAPQKARAVDRSSSLYPPTPTPNTSTAATTAAKQQQQQQQAQPQPQGGSVDGGGGGVGQGWFGSMNVPSDREVYDYLGFGLRDPASIKYQLEQFVGAPRGAQLAARQGDVVDVDSMKRVIQYNDWRNDPSSLGHPLIAIAGRGDLEDPNAEGSLYKMEGAIDGKVVSVAEAFAGEHLSLHGRVGMTTDNGQPPFCWSKHPEFARGVGGPDCYDFQWEKLSPGKLLADALRRLEEGKGRGKQRQRQLLRRGRQ